MCTDRQRAIFVSRLFGKKRKTEDEQIVLCEGVTLLNHPEIADGGRGGTRHPYAGRRKHADSRGITAKCMLETLIIGGSMCGMLSCIEADYGVPFILIMYVILSAYFCSLFKSGKVWVRDVGYIAFLAVFIGFILVFKTYVNSGFYAMVNEFLDHVTDYYGAEEVKVFSETIENRPVTVPIAAVAVGCVEIIILNIFLNTGMSVFWAVWFGLPVFILPLFFRLEPDVIYLFMVAAGILGVICLNGNGHYKITDNDDTFDYDRKKHRLSYRHSDRASRQLALWTLAVCVFAGGIVMVVRPIDSFYYRYRDSSVKNKIEAPLGNLIMYGFEALRNSYNVGGLASGQLGNVSDVTLDGETDMILRFAPYTTGRMYLKSFTGCSYDWDHWNEDDAAWYSSPVGGASDDSQADAAEDNAALSHGRMLVVIKDMMEGDVRGFYPYYTVHSETGSPESFDTEFTPLRSLDETRDNDYYGSDFAYYLDFYPYAVPDETEYEQYIYDTYMDIPEVNLPVIQSFCEAAGVSADDSDEVKVSKIADYFAANYPYTLHPGSTPRNEDYVNYFLGTTKKGLCANYATAGALILRYLGVPTRYVEGYAVDYSEVLDGTLMDEEEYPYEDYYSGESELGETAVVEVAVDDGGAHAWIEAYIDGGWRVVELTPPSTEEEDEQTEDFWTRFGRWLAGDDTGDGSDGTTGVAGTFSLSKNMWIIYVLLAVILLIICAFWVRIAVVKLMRILSYHRRDKTVNIIAYYRYMCSYARLADAGFAKAGSHEEQLAVLAPAMADEARRELANYLEAISYGGVMAGEEYPERMKTLRRILKEYRERQKFMLRLYIFRRI